MMPDIQMGREWAVMSLPANRVRALTAVPARFPLMRATGLAYYILYTPAWEGLSRTFLGLRPTT